MPDGESAASVVAGTAWPSPVPLAALVPAAPCPGAPVPGRDGAVPVSGESANVRPFWAPAALSHPAAESPSTAAVSPQSVDCQEGWALPGPPTVAGPSPAAAGPLAPGPVARLAPLA